MEKKDAQYKSYEKNVKDCSEILSKAIDCISDASTKNIPEHECVQSFHLYCECIQKK